MTNRYNNSLLTPSLFLKIGGWRQPIIMVDRIIDFTPGEKGSITVIKHVTYNDNYMLGHYPEDPVMPGIMIAEIFGQASEYFSFIDDFCSIYKQQTSIVLNSFSEVSQVIKQPESELILVVHRSRVSGVLVSHDLKFKNPAYPGDTIEVKSSLLLSDINNFKHYLVEARVGKKIIAHGKIVNYREDIKFK